MRRSEALTRLWARAFDETHVIVTQGREARVERLMASLPFDPALLTIDTCPPGRDCLTGAPESNHHVLVGNRHKQIVAGARQRGLRNVFVFEDDAEFVEGDEDVLRRALAWVDAHRHKWDVFYLGYQAPLLSTASFAARGIVKPRRPLYAHALCYSADIYDEFLAVDLAGDHRPAFFRMMERLAFPGGRAEAYFREGVGSIDTWLSFSGARRFAVHPILVVQTSLPPGTEEGWVRRTGRPYDVRETPRTLARIALGLHYGIVSLALVALLVAAITVRAC
jgi:hypothetical protein